ncbi:response regulator [bacterium]|nr:MAG: response regulator [bacterium]
MPNLLLVEDMPDSLGAFVTSLRMAGHTVVGITDPCAAVETYRQQQQSGSPFDLVVLDLAMPNMNGFEVADQLRALDEGARIAFLTAFDEPLSVGRAEAGGAIAFWSKPLTAPTLIANVAKALR